jgi:hypothetical protein
MLYQRESIVCVVSPRSALYRDKARSDIWWIHGSERVRTRAADSWLGCGHRSRPSDAPPAAAESPWSNGRFTSYSLEPREL